MSGDQARVSVSIAVPPERAFDLFTREIDQWWRRGPKYRHAGTARGFMHIEPRQGGRVFESFDGGDGSVQVVDVGVVQVWAPPTRLVFSWRNATFAVDEWTEVEVGFAAMATTSGAGTLLTVTHRGWQTLRADHPARHGLAGAAFSRMIGLWWGEQMSALRLFSTARPGTSAG